MAVVCNTVTYAYPDLLIDVVCMEAAILLADNVSTRLLRTQLGSSTSSLLIEECNKMVHGSDRSATFLLLMPCEIRHEKRASKGYGYDAVCFKTYKKEKIHYLPLYITS